MADNTYPKLHYIYTFCNDLDAVRAFYTDGLGLTEGMYEPEYGCLSYKIQGMEFMFWKTDEDLKKPADFAGQPGGGGGAALVTSWTIVVAESEFPSVVSKLTAMGVEINKGGPQWLQDSYWAFVVKDPAGNTVEVCTYPAERPASTVW